jgi:hypothetical protein
MDRLIEEKEPYDMGNLVSYWHPLSFLDSKEKLSTFSLTLNNTWKIRLS